MVRGFEIILKGRDPRDAWAFTERACGVCTTVHALASVRTVEDALGIAVPPNAELVRNLMFCAQYMQDHVVHFYHLHALDWVDVVSALKADPVKTSEIAQSISSLAEELAEVLRRRPEAPDGASSQSGQLGIFANGYWGHPGLQAAARGQPPGNGALPRGAEWQKEIVKVHTIFGGKNPHPNYLVGGAPCSVNIDDANAINAERLAYVRQLLDDAKTFIEQVYIPDLLAVASFYKDWGAIGGGLTNYLAYGDLPTQRLPRPEPASSSRGAPSSTATWAKVLEVDGQRRGAGPGVHRPLLVRVPGRRRGGQASLGRRDQAELHRPEAALRTARCRGKVQLAEDAALERPRDGGRPAGAPAGRLRRPDGRKSRISWTAR